MVYMSSFLQTAKPITCGQGSMGQGCLSMGRHATQFIQQPQVCL